MYSITESTNANAFSRNVNQREVKFVDLLKARQTKRFPNVYFSLMCYCLFVLLQRKVSVLRKKKKNKNQMFTSVHVRKSVKGHSFVVKLLCL